MNKTWIFSEKYQFYIILQQPNKEMISDFNKKTN